MGIYKPMEIMEKFPVSPVVNQSVSNPRPVPQPRFARDFSDKQTLVLPLIVILLVAVIETRMIWAPCLLWGHSAVMDATRLVEFDAAIRAGNYFPAWSPDLYSGYGSPLFQFYAPLAYFAAEAPMLAGVGVATALKITLAAALFASGLAMYRLTTTHLSRWAACFGAVLYMVTPYRIVDLLVRHALAEHCAFVWFPLIAWGTERFVAERSRVGFATGVLATTGLVLTHNVMALAGLPVCVGVGWALCGRRHGIRTLLSAAIPALAGVGIAATFWWPALAGRRFVCAEASLTQGYFDFHRHFVEAWRFLDIGWAFGGSGLEDPSRIPLEIGWPHLIAGVCVLILAICKRGSHKEAATRSRWAIAGIVTMAGSALLCHRVSLPLWEALPLVKYVQFPWRFLGLVTFGASLCGAALVDCVKSSRGKAALSGVGIVIVLAAYFPYYANARFLVCDLRSKLPLPVTSEQFDVLKAAGAAVPMDRYLTLDLMRAAGETATSSDDYLPSQVRKKPAIPPAAPLAVKGGAVRQFARLGLNRYRVAVSMSEAGTVELAQFWFPGWTARLDGKKVDAAPFGDAAVVSCQVPAGEHVIEYEYVAMPQRRAGIAVSLVATAGAIFSFLGCKKGGGA